MEAPSTELRMQIQFLEHGYWPKSLPEARSLPLGYDAISLFL
jgi:hypothetical protein